MFFNIIYYFMKKSPVIEGFGMSLENINNKIQFNKENLKTIYLAGGCFWGVETYISRILGVYKTEVGYANGNTKNPTYEEVCNFDTKHAECVKVTYSLDFISLKELLEEFFKNNRSNRNQQTGSRYRNTIQNRNLLHRYCR